MPLTEEERARLNGLWVDGQMVLDNGAAALALLIKQQKALDELVRTFRADLVWLRALVEEHPALRD